MNGGVILQALLSASLRGSSVKVWLTGYPNPLQEGVSASEMEWVGKQTDCFQQIRRKTVSTEEGLATRSPEGQQPERQGLSSVQPQHHGQAGSYSPQALASPGGKMCQPGPSDNYSSMEMHK